MLDAFAEYHIFPDELSPEENNSWRGIEFSAWADYILNRPIDVKAKVTEVVPA